MLAQQFRFMAETARECAFRKYARKKKENHRERNTGQIEVAQQIKYYLYTSKQLVKIYADKKN
jgi:hypothetical protein